MYIGMNMSKWEWLGEIQNDTSPSPALLKIIPCRKIHNIYQSFSMIFKKSSLFFMEAQHKYNDNFI